MRNKTLAVVAQAISDGQFINLTTNAELAVNVQTRAKIARQIAVTIANRKTRVQFLNACGITEKLV